jgi:hypothetical protein
LTCILPKENGFSDANYRNCIFNCWPNDTTEPFLCDKFSHILVAALPLLQTMWPVMVLFNHFRKDQQSFSWASEVHFTDCLCLLEMV